MIFRKCIIVLIFLSIPFLGFTQKFNGYLLAGLSTSQINGDLYQGFHKLGLFTGVGVSNSFSKAIGVKIELYYIGKGAKQNIGGIEAFKTKLHYVEMPFLLNFKPVDQFEFDIGLACSFLVKSKLFEQGAQVTTGLNDMLSFDLGAIASATYNFSEKLGLNVRMEHSVLPIKNYPNWYNYNLSFGIAYRILSKNADL